MPRLQGVKGSKSFGLLDLDRRARVLEELLALLGVFLAHLLLDGLGSAVNEVLRFLEAEARESADFLDDLDLLGARVLEEERELGLLLLDLGHNAGPDGHHHAAAATRSLDAELVLDLLHEGREVEDRHLLDDAHDEVVLLLIGELGRLVNHLSNASHRSISVVSERYPVGPRVLPD